MKGRLVRSRVKLDDKSLYRIHNKGTDRKYTEYYYILEAKIVPHPDIIVSIMTEFVENTDGKEAEIQDCELKACYRRMALYFFAVLRLPLPGSLPAKIPLPVPIPKHTHAIV